MKVPLQQARSLQPGLGKVHWLDSGGILEFQLAIFSAVVDAALLGVEDDALPKSSEAQTCLLTSVWTESWTASATRGLGSRQKADESLGVIPTDSVLRVRVSISCSRDRASCSSVTRVSAILNDNCDVEVRLLRLRGLRVLGNV